MILIFSLVYSPTFWKQQRVNCAKGNKPKCPNKAKMRFLMVMLLRMKMKSQLLLSSGGEKAESSLHFLVETRRDKK